MRRWSRIILIYQIILLFLLVAPIYLFAEEYTLDDLYRIALERSEKIKLSEQNLAISEITKDKVVSYLIPRLTTYGSYTRYTESKRAPDTNIGAIKISGSLFQPETAVSWGLRLDQTMSLSGREFTALDMSKESIRKSQYDLLAVREEYLFSLASTYYDFLKMKKTLDIAYANMERLTKYRNAAEKRLKVGEVTRTVLLRAEGELSGAKADLVKTQNGLELTKAFLSRIVGIDKDFQVKETPASNLEIKSLSFYQEAALSERADIISLEIQKKIAEEQVQYTKGSYWPSLSLTGVYARLDWPNDVNLPSSLNKESIYAGISLNFPFFEGGLRIAEVKEAKTRGRQAALLYEDSRKTIAMEIEAIYLDILTQQGTLKFLEDQLSYARDNYYAVSKQFEFGLSSSIDVMDANTLLVSAERKMAEALYTYQVSVLKMKKATGVFLKEIMDKKY